MIVVEAAHRLSTCSISASRKERDGSLGSCDVRWFSLTRRPKVIGETVPPFAKLQADGLSAAEQSAAIESDLVDRYANFGIQAIQPRRSLHVRRISSFVAAPACWPISLGSSDTLA